MEKTNKTHLIYLQGEVSGFQRVVLPLGWHIHGVLVVRMRSLGELLPERPLVMGLELGRPQLVPERLGQGQMVQQRLEQQDLIAIRNVELSTQ